MPQQDFLRDIAGGFTLGAGIADQQAKRAQQEAAVAAQQAKLLREQQYQTDVNALLANPTPRAALTLRAKYPEHQEAFGGITKDLTAEQLDNEMRDISTVGAALQSERSDVALSKIDQRIAAMKASGADTAEMQMLRDAIVKDPKAAWLARAHEALDAAVAAAYGWTDYTPGMSDDEILVRLLRENLQRAQQRSGAQREMALLGVVGRAATQQGMPLRT